MARDVILRRHSLGRVKKDVRTLPAQQMDLVSCVVKTPAGQYNEKRVIDRTPFELLRVKEMALFLFPGPIVSSGVFPPESFPSNFLSSDHDQGIQILTKFYPCLFVDNKKLHA